MTVRRANSGASARRCIRHCWPSAVNSPLVNPADSTLDRGQDGLFRLRDGTQAEADASVHLTSGALESSNVNVAEAMTQMIELAHRYELQVKAIRTAEEDAGAASKLLQTS